MPVALRDFLNQRIDQNDIIVYPSHHLSHEFLVRAQVQQIVLGRDQQAPHANYLIVQPDHSGDPDQDGVFKPVRIYRYDRVLVIQKGE